MPKMIPMVALVAFDRNGKHLKAGDQFDAFPIEAASLKYNRKARYGSVADKAASQSYPTRHMTAQTPGASSPQEAPQRDSPPAHQATAETTQRTDSGGNSRQSRRAARSQGYATRDLGASETE